MGSAAASIDKSLTSAALKTTDGVKSEACTDEQAVYGSVRFRIGELTKFIKSISGGNFFRWVRFATFGTHRPDWDQMVKKVNEPQLIKVRLIDEMVWQEIVVYLVPN